MCSYECKFVVPHVRISSNFTTDNIYTFIHIYKVNTCLRILSPYENDIYLGKDIIVLS